MWYKQESIPIDVNGTVEIPLDAIEIKHEFVGHPACVQVSWLVPIEDW